MTPRRVASSKGGGADEPDAGGPALTLSVVERNIEVRCGVVPLVAGLRRALSAMLAPAAGDAPSACPSATPSARPPAADLCYDVLPAPEGAFEIRRSTGGGLRAADEGECIVELSRDLVVQLQMLRPDLFFVHAAVLERHGSALMLVGASGAGKSTTTWALTSRGFRYLSDELAPIDIDPDHARVWPFPQAVCLKSDPPAPFRLPATTLRTTAALHVPVESLDGGVGSEPIPLATIVFLQGPGNGERGVDPRAVVRSADRGRIGPRLRALAPAEAGARLFAGNLNAGAHPHHGVDSALEVARQARSYVLTAGELAAVCNLIESAATGQVADVEL